MKNYKVLLIVLGVVLLLSLVGYGYFKAIPEVENKGNIPKIEIYPKTFDFGEINFRDVVNHSFTVKNTGNEVLEIKRVTTSCPCASAQITEEKINPEESTELLVSYDSEAMGAHGRGEQERIIYIRSNDPINPQIEVIIYANVK